MPPPSSPRCREMGATMLGRSKLSEEYLHTHFLSLCTHSPCGVCVVLFEWGMKLMVLCMNRDLYRWSTLCGLKQRSVTPTLSRSELAGVRSLSLSSLYFYLSCCSSKAWVHNNPRQPGQGEQNDVKRFYFAYFSFNISRTPRAEPVFLAAMLAHECYD